MQEFQTRCPSGYRAFPDGPHPGRCIFPFTKVAFKIGRHHRLALEQAMVGERQIFLATQHDATVDEPTSDQIYRSGP